MEKSESGPLNMEKSESGPLKSVASIFGVVARIFGVLAVTVIILIVLFIGTFLYQINRQADKGKDWCERVSSANMKRIERSFSKCTRTSHTVGV
jgi:uncharacterized membrane protein